MAEPISIQTLLTYLTLISVPVGVFYHIMTLRNTRKNQELQLETRQAQLFMDVYRDFKRPEIQKAFNNIVYDWEWDSIEEFTEKYGRSNNYEEFHKYMLVYSVYEGLGVLIYRNLIDVNMIEELMRSYVVSFWEKMAPVIYVWREQWPLAAEWMEYLYKEVKKIESVPAYLR